MNTNQGPGIKVKMGGTGIVTPHPEDNSEWAQAIRRALKLEAPVSTHQLEEDKKEG